MTLMGPVMVAAFYHCYSLGVFSRVGQGGLYRFESWGYCEKKRMGEFLKQDNKLI